MRKLHVEILRLESIDLIPDLLRKVRGPFTMPVTLLKEFRTFRVRSFRFNILMEVGIVFRSTASSI